MQDFSDRLNPGEEVLHVARPSLVALIPLALLDLVFVVLAIVYWKMFDSSKALLVWLALAVVSTAVLLIRWIPLRMTRYVLTTRRVMRESGLFTRTSTDSYLDKINNVEHRQTLLGRMLGYGELEIDTASETGTTRFSHVARPFEFKKAILSAREQLRQPGFATATPATAAPAAADRLQQLAALRDNGTITPEEYAAKRAQILSEL